MIQVKLKKNFTLMVNGQYVMCQSDDVDMVTVAQNLVDALQFGGLDAELIVEGP